MGQRRLREQLGPIPVRIVDPAARPAFRVGTVAETNALVTASGGLRVAPAFTFTDCPASRIVVVPGGHGTRRELTNLRLLDWLRCQARQAEVMASVCTGSFLLAAAGLLDGRHATTHWASIDRMRAAFPAVNVVGGKRVVEDGNIVTARRGGALAANCGLERDRSSP